MINPNDLVPGTPCQHVRNRTIYIVEAVGEHSETHERLVAYRAAYGQPGHDPKRVWIRPLGMFCDGRFEAVSAGKVPAAEYAAGWAPPRNQE